MMQEHLLVDLSNVAAVGPGAGPSGEWFWCFPIAVPLSLYCRLNTARPSRHFHCPAVAITAFYLDLFTVSRRQPASDLPATSGGLRFYGLMNEQDAQMLVRPKCCCVPPTCPHGGACCASPAARGALCVFAPRPCP